MTEKFILSSALFEGELILEFRLDGTLVRFSNEAELNASQLTFLAANFPVNVTAANKFIKDAKNITAKHFPAEVQFLDFWEAYGNKANSNKKLSEKVFEKLTLKEKVQVMEDIPRYRQRLIKQPGISQKYAETYLRSRVWEQ
ncbi:hypothetical protein SAMN04515674_101501 [Pseudarcicella hirudinis]|uniref:Uncharacterized protein n=1 Tax=Pseudarcicella hirudinis TaxID=1079859 RepID=A0A1I5MY83_9BACT|nr:hypothetical protein [Pseudarcicella hirudinis]SFP14347.1 hypothetical protein SAMN04515674_101501 [Pseudarcicella hirudinis]